MAEVKIQEGESIESALRRFKRKVQQEDIIKDIKKHSLQKTGLPCVGRKGTVVSFPHAEHWVWVSTRSRIEGPALTRFARLALHALQRFGSFLNCLSAKKSCSPAVQINSDPQSTHLRALSWNSIGRHLCSSSILAPAPSY